MTRRTIAAGLFCTAALALPGCGLLGRDAAFRFRMTVDVATSEGVKRGSAVYQVAAHAGLFNLGDVSGNSVGIVDGEAAVVELPNGPLFVLLALPKAGGPLGSLASAALTSGMRSDGLTFIKAVRKLGKRSAHVSAELPRKHWPMMVRFVDPADPKTVEMVDSGSIGVQRILLETTTDPVTNGIRTLLPWLQGNGKRLAPGVGASIAKNSPLYERLGQGLFKAGSW